MSANQIVEDLKRLAASVEEPVPVREDPARLATLIAKAVGDYLLESMPGPGYHSTDFNQLSGGILWGVSIVFEKLLKDNPAAAQSGALNDYADQTNRMVAYVWQQLRRDAC